MTQQYDLSQHPAHRFESSKSHKRHLHDNRFATKYFVGNGIDVGSGYDCLEHYRPLFPLMQEVRNWETEDGDAQYLKTIADNSMDFLFSSHCLEHVQHPYITLFHWFRVLKPGGHMVVVVPDEDMYEQGLFPSKKNPDHKWSFSIHKRQSWSQVSVNILDLVTSLGDDAQILKIESCDAGYHYIAEPHDQTVHFAAECAIEIIIRKHQAHETDMKGRMPLYQGIKDNKIVNYAYPIQYDHAQLPNQIRNPKKQQ